MPRYVAVPHHIRPRAGRLRRHRAQSKARRTSRQARPAARRQPDFSSSRRGRPGSVLPRCIAPLLITDLCFCPREAAIRRFSPLPACGKPATCELFANSIIGPMDRLNHSIWGHARYALAEGASAHQEIRRSSTTVRWSATAPHRRDTRRRDRYTPPSLTPSPRSACTTTFSASHHNPNCGTQLPLPPRVSRRPPSRPAPR